MISLNRRLRIILSSVPVLLLIPLVAMWLTDEVTWSFMDFLVMGVLLSGLGLAVELVLRKVRGPKQRALLLGVGTLLFLLVWAELAVGVFGSPFAGS